MKTREIQFTAPGKVELVNTEVDETLQPDEVLLKTEVTLISPGTELDNLAGRVTSSRVSITLGYSAVATVLKTGDKAANEFRPGDRCLCYHSDHCGYQKKNGNALSGENRRGGGFDEAVFMVVGCMGFQRVRRCRPEFGESLMVMGLGLLGQFAVQTARLSGCFPVIALDYQEKRRAIALRLGADAAFSPDDPKLEEKVKVLTRGRGCDCVIEVTGNPQALIGGLKLTARFGRIALVGCSRTPTESIDFYNLVHRPGIDIIGAHNMARPERDARPGRMDDERGYADFAAVPRRRAVAKHPAHQLQNSAGGSPRDLRAASAPRSGVARRHLRLERKMKKLGNV